MQFLFNNKKLLGLSCLVILLLAGIYLYNNKITAYAVVIDGQEKFWVKDCEEVNELVSELTREHEELYSKKFEIDNKIEFKKVSSKGKLISKKTKIKEVLKECVHYKVNASTIKVNGKNIAYLNSKDEAEEILERLKNENKTIDEGEKLLSLELEEDVEVVEEIVNSKDIISAEKAWDLITMGTEDPQKYVIKEGDSLWLIARRNDMYVDDILKANKLEEDDILSLGQELTLVKMKPYINVIAKIEGEKDEKIPFETKVIVDNNSNSAIKVKQVGQAGSRHISYVATVRNGIVEDKEIVTEKILKKAVDRIVIKGNRVVQVASRGGGGILDWPVFGTITQYYKGRRHTGLDIASKRGTPIKAAERGVVTSASYRGNYGYFIIVDHGNGIVTRYAHCDSFKAKVGQNVAKGEVIAYLGNTGRSTGPHLHFEVLVNGSFKNPLSYLH